MTTVLIILKNSFIQFWALFGVFLAGGLILTILSRLTGNVFRQFAFPRTGLYLFGLIGIPTHELSHAIFCKIFLHDVKKIKWFDAHGKGGAQGSVTHIYNPWNLYHRIGHFFIGLAPALLGPIFMALLFYFLVPQAHEFFMISSLTIKAKILFSHATLTSPGFYVFAYFAMCISSQIDLSNEDLKQVGTGVIPISAVLVLGNILAWSVGANWHTRILHFSSQAFSLCLGVFIFAATLSLINLLVCTIFFGIINRIIGRNAINPFLAPGPDAP